MRALSNSNLIPHFTFHMLSEDRIKHVHSKLVETVTQIVRWAVVGIVALIIVLPAIISFSNPI